MKAFALVMLMGCGIPASQVIADVAQGVSDGACVIAQVAEGNTDSVSILSKCFANTPGADEKLVLAAIDAYTTNHPAAAGEPNIIAAKTNAVARLAQKAPGK